MSKKHNKRVIDVLLFILDKLSKESINWVLVGSTNLVIQGVDTEAKDIDIITSKEDIYKFYNHFSEFGKKEVTYSSVENYRSYFGKLEINGILIELMADLEYRKDGFSSWIKSKSLENKQIISFENYLVPVIPLKQELNFYKIMKRENDSKKIKSINQFKQEK